MSHGISGVRRVRAGGAWIVLIALAICGFGRARADGAPAAQTAVPDTREDRAALARRALDTMKRATAFMVERVSTEGGYVWSYLPDMSRRWGELEARSTMIWIQPPGTASMGHLFLDAYHATGDEFYYRAAAQVAGALLRAQHPSGGWNYVADFAGSESLRAWYDTVGRNAWRLEEFHQYRDNATFDDGGTAEASTLLLRIYLEKQDPRYKSGLDRAIRFVLDSQYPVGAWPQRYPPVPEAAPHGRPDYTSFLTFNDDVAATNIEFLILCYQGLGDRRVLDALARAMNAFIVLRLKPPQAGWALQYTPDLRPAGARTYEPAALSTHTTAENIQALLGFYRLTGDVKFLEPIPDALDWLDAVRLPPDLVVEGRAHPTFVEVGTNVPLFIHRRGSNVVNGKYYVDGNPHDTIGHYNSFRRVDVHGLREEYRAVRAIPPEEAVKTSPLVAGGGVIPLPRLFAAVPGTHDRGAGSDTGETVAQVIESLGPEGYWPAPLGTTSNPYRGHGPAEVTPGDFSATLVGDSTDTSPYRVEGPVGISTRVYIRNMGVLIRYLEGNR